MMCSQLRKSPIPMQTLVLIAIVHELGDKCPFFGVLVVKADQLLVLLWSPSLDLSLLAVYALLPDLHIDLNPVESLYGHHKLSFPSFFHQIIIEEHALYYHFKLPSKEYVAQWYLWIHKENYHRSRDYFFQIKYVMVTINHLIIMRTSLTAKCQTDSCRQGEEHFIGDYETAPEYMKDNLHITHGYRINFNTTKKILKSLFMVHNQSVNIWSHCVPAAVIVFFLISFLFFIDGEAMRNSMKSYRQEIDAGLHHYMHALDNLSLISQYDALSKKTKIQMEQLKRTVMQNYQQFTANFQEGSAHLQNLLESEMEGLKSNIKETLKANMGKFERAKIEFQTTIAPMLIDEFNEKVNVSWVRQLKQSIQKLKKTIDSEQFQYMELHEHRPNPQQVSRWPMVVFLTTALICLLSSALFHLFYPMSAKIYTLTNRFDYAGINLLISGSAFPPLYYGMYCQIAVAIFYLSISIVIATACFIVCLFEWIHRAENTKYKAFLFGGYGLTMLVPLSHLMINDLVYDNYGDTFQFASSFPYYVLLGVSYLGGLYIYTVRCPERNNPGKYNLCGHSHQIWHGMVVLGVLFTYMGALENFEMRKVSYCPA